MEEFNKETLEVLFSGSERVFEFTELMKKTRAFIQEISGEVSN